MSARAFSSEVDAGSREENALKQKPGAPIRFHRIGKGSRAWIAAIALAFATPALAQGFAGLGGDAAGFEKVVPGKPLQFPQDFGAHNNFRTEWWYVTANLTDESGAPYGVQWTLFRQAGAPGDERPGWASQTVWMGHAAVTSATDHLFAETFARGGIGQAGVTANPFRAFIDDWIFSGGGAEGCSRQTFGERTRVPLRLRPRRRWTCRAPGR